MAFCPTKDMIAHFFTKPLQGVLFLHMHDQILNLPPVKILTFTGVCWRALKSDTDQKCQTARRIRMDRVDRDLSGNTDKNIYKSKK